MFDGGSMSPLMGSTYTSLGTAFYIQLHGMSPSRREVASSSSETEHKVEFVIVPKGYYAQHAYKVAQASGQSQCGLNFCRFGSKLSKE